MKMTQDAMKSGETISRTELKALFDNLPGARGGRWDGFKKQRIESRAQVIMLTLPVFERWSVAFVANQLQAVQEH